MERVSLISYGSKNAELFLDQKNPESSLRRHLFVSLGDLFAKIQNPSTEIEQALENKIIYPEFLAKVYQELSEFLEVDETNARLILYLPFELLPTSRSVNQDLQKEQERFCKAYLDSWIRLLGKRDVASNFIDGDILEPELGLGLSPLVVKAAHLIPFLIEKGLIDITKVVEIAQVSDQILVNSILDTIEVMAEKRLLSSRDWDLLLASSSENIAVSASQIMCSHLDGIPQIGCGDLEGLEKELQEVVKRQREQHEKGKIPPERIDWDAKVKRIQTIEKYTQKTSLGDLENLADTKTLDNDFALLLAKSLAINVKDPAIYDNFEEIFIKLVQHESPEVRDVVTTCLYHLAHLKVISANKLRSFGLETPLLDALSPLKQQEIQDTLQQFKDGLEKISCDEYLKDKLYPTFLFFGSKFKGYAGEQADCDIAVFIKPGVDFQERDEILTKLTQIFADEAPQSNDRGIFSPLLRRERNPSEAEIHSHSSASLRSQVSAKGDKKGLGKVVEFWLEENYGILEIKEVSLITNSIADQDWVHLLLTGLWLGQKIETEKIRNELVEGYLKRGNSNQKAREFWLNQIEREVLQYRLMHKGYTRFFTQTQKESFYDPGFRRVASRLFISKVFLPKK